MLMGTAGCSMPATRPAASVVTDRCRQLKDVRAMSRSGSGDHDAASDERWHGYAACGAALLQRKYGLVHTPSCIMHAGTPSEGCGALRCLW